MALTDADIVQAVNDAGMSTDQLVTAFKLIKSIIDAGFSDPGPFTQVLVSFKLQNDKWKLEQEVVGLQAQQQAQMQEVLSATDPTIIALKNQIAAIDDQLKDLQS